jgi:hypothetical protein
MGTQAIKKLDLISFYKIKNEFDLSVSFHESTKIWEVVFCMSTASQFPFMPVALEEASFQDFLWKSTCLEVFEFDLKTTKYVEWNFSPSGNWAQYHFSNYRIKDESLSRLNPSSWSWTKSQDQRILELKLPKVFPQSKLQFSAVIDWSQEGLDYYALSHPKDSPDFHQKL